MDFRLETVDDGHVAGIHEASVADLKMVAEHCGDLRSAGYTGSSDMKLAARVPGFFVQKYINDNGITFAEFMRGNKHIDRFLADPALSHFRVWGGRV
jgi:hypothetical protein